MNQKVNGFLGRRWNFIIFIIDLIIINIISNSSVVFTVYFFLVYRFKGKKCNLYYFVKSFNLWDAAVKWGQCRQRDSRFVERENVGQGSNDYNRREIAGREKIYSIVMQLKLIFHVHTASRFDSNERVHRVFSCPIWDVLPWRSRPSLKRKSPDFLLRLFVDILPLMWISDVANRLVFFNFPNFNIQWSFRLV